MVKAEFTDFSIRFSNYLLNNLNLNETLNAIDIEKYLQNKRIPIDTKSLHGNYAKIKIEKILLENGYKNLDPILKAYKIKTLEPVLTKQIDTSALGSSKIYCTEKYIEGVKKVETNKPKKFDLIIFNDFKPRHLFEMNFYSTEGTKIGINEGEYVSLDNFIKAKFPSYEFYWITDGNYWLTEQGKERFLNLLKSFKKILNINIFAEKIKEFEMRQ